MLDHNLICLAGPPSSGKTSLLFRQALHWVARQQRVVFLTPSPLETLPLTPVTPGSDSAHQIDSQILNRIHFKYPESLTNLLHYLSTLHTHSDKYHSIVVDDLHKFIPPGKGASVTADVAQVCAYIIDAAKFMEQQMKKEIPGAVEPLRVAVSLSTHTHNDLMAETVKRWLPGLFTISSHGENEFSITETGTGLTHFHYRLAHPHLQIMPTT